MLVLARERNQSVIISRSGTEIGRVSLVDIRGERARLGFDFPLEYDVDRLEIFDKRREAPAEQANASLRPLAESIMLNTSELRQQVIKVVQETPVFDMHTHLFPPVFGPMMLWGIDELLTYHYLIAEVFRVAPLPYERFWAMNTREQADYIWKHLFVERSPVSEACRGVLTVLHALGLDTEGRSLASVRKYFASVTAEEYMDRVFTIANVSRVVMTNDPFDDTERPIWQAGGSFDPRFQTALRIDALLNSFEAALPRLREWGYPVRGDLLERDVQEISRFLNDWVDRLRPRYMAVSLPPDFAFPEDSVRGALLERCVLPVARETGIPFAMMIGVKRGINPGLRLAADGVGRSEVGVVDALCRQFPDNRFMVTMLSRENQHELAVSARKHPNLLVFGCWWFLNNPTLIDELTRMRMEMLGLSFVPQHSDARVLDQLIYKWVHSRTVIAQALADKYADIAATGWQVTEADIRRDVRNLLADNFDRFSKRGN